jgi:EAL domain-containing protein (putative c-di-GMP-specific phosphodiesterase class I)
VNALPQLLENRASISRVSPSAPVTEAATKAAIESARINLDIGLAGKEFVPFFQPQIDAPSGRLLGLEVLTRWSCPGLGILSPRRFLPQAARLGLLEQIEDQVLDAVQTNLMRWDRKGISVPKVSLNCTARRLACPSFLDRAAALGQYTASVALEVLETVSFEEAGPELLRQIRSARGRGLLIEVDDFGSGAASIAGAMALQPDTLKIDRTLVRGVHNSRRRREILRSIIAIAKTLNARLIAEGVQVIEEATALIELGVTSHQGYFHAHPMSADDLYDWMRRRLA